ncbi:MAG TPA: hypothetical protein PLM29_00190 [Deltaproteobacteria bacterium]|nr:hypothetical protein [Deltaproteobacteria bacterium]
MNHKTGQERSGLRREAMMSADITGGNTVSENQPVKIPKRRLNKKTDLSDRIAYSEIHPILNRISDDIQLLPKSREKLAEISCFMKMCT